MQRIPAARGKSTPSGVSCPKEQLDNFWVLATAHPNPCHSCQDLYIGALVSTICIYCIPLPRWGNPSERGARGTSAASCLTVTSVSSMSLEAPAWYGVLRRYLLTSKSRQTTTDDTNLIYCVQVPPLGSKPTLEPWDFNTKPPLSLFHLYLCFIHKPTSLIHPPPPNNHLKPPPCWSEFVPPMACSA